MTYEPEQLGRSKADLADRLRELRKQAGLTGDRLAARVNFSQSKISKIENGKLTPTIVDVERVLRALEAPSEVVDEITALARLANTEWEDERTSWRRGLEKRQIELATVESSARELRYFLPSMVTGLLATAEYVRASLDYTPGDKTKAIARKLERQAVLFDESKRFTFILTEQAVKWAVLKPFAMAAQIERLISLSHVPTVRIGVVPYGTRLSRGPMNTFTIYDDRLVTVETFTGRLVLQDARDVAEHLQLFAIYESCSIFGEQARLCLRDWASMYRQ